MMATLNFIKQNISKDRFGFVKIVLHHNHDLIRKAVCWTLRKTGDRDRASEERYLKKRYQKMPRTMLRCAIEKLPEQKRKRYLVGAV